MCPLYKIFTGLPLNDPEIIKANLIKQLTNPVRWTQTMENMIADGAKVFVEVGPGTVLQGLVKKVNKDIEAGSAQLPG